MWYNIAKTTRGINNMKAIDFTGLVDKLQATRDLTDEEFSALLSTGAADAELFDAADTPRGANYGDKIYNRGLLELTNYFKKKRD